MYICSPEGWNSVSPPSTREPSAFGGSMRFLMRTLAKVPRIITSWLPRRAAEVLESPCPPPLAVEIRLRHAVGDEVLARGRRFLDRSGGRDVVGGDRVAEDAEHASAVHV